MNVRTESQSLAFRELPMNSAFQIVFRHVLAALAASLVCAAGVRAADTGKIVVQVNKPGAKISPMLYGLMTEEINYSYDGGIYGELIRNRIFKDRSRGGAAAVPAIPHWSVTSLDDAQGEISLDTADPVNPVALTTSLKLNVASAGAGRRVGVANDGYWGIPVRPNATYQASFYAKASNGFSGPLTVDIESNDGTTIFAYAIVPAVTDKWQKYSVALKTAQVPPTAAARFVISTASTGTLNFNLVSLFPPTYKDRVNGNRVEHYATPGRHETRLSPFARRKLRRRVELRQSLGLASDHRPDRDAAGTY